MLCSLSRLDDTKIKTIQSLEQKLGKPLLAYSCYSLAPADLTQDELKQITEAEQKLGLALVAVKS